MRFLVRVVDVIEPMHLSKTLWVLPAILALTACTTVDWSAERARALEAASAPDVSGIDGAKLLETPLDRETALRVALIKSPDLRRLMSLHDAELNAVASNGRLANPSFSYQRLRSAESVDIERWLSLGVLDVMTWPQRQRVADAELEAVRVRLASDIVDRLTAIRNAWTIAVATGEKRRYAERVLASAQASAELALRMEMAGNFNRLDRARQQSYEADARSRLTRAQQDELVARESLVRLLGLEANEVSSLRLPPRLPALPTSPVTPPEASRALNDLRLDLRLANAEWRAAAAANGLSKVTSVTDVSVALREQDTRGFEVDLSLPLFDPGDLQRGAARARVQAAIAQLEQTALIASSDLRVSYSAYRRAYDDAIHHRDVLVPLRRSISDETLLRYNGMLIGVFELLSDAREQVQTVVEAIEANERFWLADAQLQASLLGRPEVEK